MSSSPTRPLISVIMPVHDPRAEDLQAALRSYARQVWPFRELCIADDASMDPDVQEILDKFSQRPDVHIRRLESNLGIAGATNAALEMASGEFSLFLDHDDELSDNALWSLVRLLEEHPDADFIYSDHDIVDSNGERGEVWHKPGWSPELLLSYMYVGHFKCVRTKLARDVGGFREGFSGAADYDFVLRVAEETKRIHHIPGVLYHWKSTPASMARDPDLKTYAFEAGRRAVAAALERRKINAKAVWPRWAQRARVGAYALDFDNTHESPVTIIIPTRDRLDLLASCIASIEERTEHPLWEILIVDNDSSETETLDYLASTPHRVLSVPGEFNFSRLVNHGVREATTELVVLLNNDTLVATTDWLDQLIGVSQLEGVGAVGAKLLYNDGRIQHAGVTLGVHGLSAHAFSGRLDTYSPLEAGLFAHVSRNCSAVTAACLLTRRSLYESCGGFDEDELAVAWNDVDFCLRLKQLGWRTVMNPNAELIHFESQSRGESKNDREVKVLFSRWGNEIHSDLYYNPNLTRLDTEFSPRTVLDESLYFHYTADGYREDPPGFRGASSSRIDRDDLDLEAICRSQAERLLLGQGVVPQTLVAERIAAWIDQVPLLQRFLRSRFAATLYRALRKIKRSPAARSLLRRLGLLS